MDTGQRIQGTLTHDEFCLESMRKIVKEYIVNRHQPNSEEHILRGDYLNRYEEYRKQMRDEDLRAFTPFELMEKLYLQEYLING